jgi:hypothetical protein
MRVPSFVCDARGLRFRFICLDFARADLALRKRKWGLQNQQQREQRGEPGQPMST